MSPSWRKTFAMASRARLDVGAGAYLAKLRGRLGTTAHHHQPARRFRRRQRHGEQQQSRHGGRSQHHAPRATRRQPAVDQIGKENADGDRELVAGNETAANGRRRQFGGVERRRDGGDADARADHQPPRDQDDRVGGKRLHERAQREHRARDQHRTLTAELVRQFAAGERAEQRAQRDPARHHLDQQRAERERRFDSAQRPRDHALVVAEQSAGEQDDDQHQPQPWRHDLAERSRLLRRSGCWTVPKVSGIVMSGLPVSGGAREGAATTGEPRRAMP